MDWTGNSNSVYSTLGATNHTDKERCERDYYATEPKAVELLLEKESFNSNIWECACGEGHISKVLEAHGYTVKCTDIEDRGVGGVHDFLEGTAQSYDGDIITNPPYKYAIEFVERSLDSIPQGNKVAMFLRLQFLESKARRKFFEKNPPRRVYVASSRLHCARNGDFSTSKGNNAVAYAWFVWEKGYTGKPEIDWIN